MTIYQKTAAILFFGIMATLSLSPWSFWFCGFIMLVPLFYMLEKETFSIKQSIKMGYFFTLSFNIFISYWLIYTISIYGHLHWTIAVIVFLLYTLITCLRYTIFILLIQAWKYLSEKGFPALPRILQNRYFSWTFFWGVSEYFGWQLFHALGANHAMGDFLLIQTADLVGIYGLSLIWFLINLLLYDALKWVTIKARRLDNRVSFEKKSMIFTLVLTVAMHIYGYYAIAMERERTSMYKTKLIGIVQGRAPLAFESEKSVSSQIMDTLKTQAKLTESLMENGMAAGKKPDLVVWSESSVPFLSFQRSSIFSKTISELQNKYKMAIIINDIYVDVNMQKYYNNLWLLNGNGKIIDFYHKIRLLPFGEFIPLGNYFPGFYRYVPEIAGFSPGTEKKLLDLDGLKILPSICYELLPPDFTLDFFKKSGKHSQIIINITNDTWFGDTIENAQHLQGSSLRAIELRLPIVRATNSGISAYIDTLGKVHNPIKSNIQDTRIYEIPIPDKSHSLYSFWGLWPYYLFLVIGSLLWSFPLYNIYIAGRKFRTKK